MQTVPILEQHPKPPTEVGAVTRGGPWERCEAGGRGASLSLCGVGAGPPPPCIPPALLVARLLPTGSGSSPNPPTGLCWAPLSHRLSPPRFLLPEAAESTCSAGCWEDGIGYRRGGSRKAQHSGRSPLGGLEVGLRLRAAPSSLLCESPSSANC